MNNHIGRRVSRGRGRARRPGRGPRRPSAAGRSARTRRSGCRRADTNSRRSCSQRGLSSAASSWPMRTVQSSWNAPWLRKLARCSFSDFEFDDPAVGHVVDDEMGEVRLAGDRADRGEFRRGEAHDVIGVGVRIGRRARASWRRARSESATAARDGRRTRVWRLWAWRFLAPCAAQAKRRFRSPWRSAP